jgi:Flp pilus assembly protein TadG
VGFALKRRLRAFRTDRSGNVAMLWALIGAILIGMVGLTVDFTRAQMIRAQLQNAADGAALVAERSSNLAMSQRTALARAFFNTEAGEYSNVQTFQVFELDTGGHRVEVSYVMATGLARVVKQEDWTLDVSSEAEARASPPIEVALVLDNTYSMKDDIGALRDAAHDLAEYLLSIDGDTVHVSLVPFEAYVNSGNQASHMAWMDTTGVAPYNGEILEDRLITRRDANNSSQCLGYSTNVSTGSPYNIVWSYVSGSQPRCYGRNPSNINYFTLYNTVSNISWKGCVEARPEPYDIQDNAPNVGTPATLFVPFFYIDDSDSTSGVPNNWISDNTLPSGTIQTAGRTLSVFKYDNSSASLNESHTTTNTRGPNRGCPTPIVPLTTNETTILN